MTGNGTKQQLPTKHYNKGLFSDYYLNEIIPTLAEWDNNDLLQETKSVFEQLKALLDTIHPEKLDEAQLEEQWVQPVLRLLGHHFTVQVKIRYRERSHRKPDYVFVATDDEARALTNDIYEPKDIEHVLAVGDAKKWGTHLDQASGGNTRNPSQQIDEYLRYSERPWGVLTDGRWWRLYHRDSSKYNAYYAVDLAALLDGNDIEDFQYFYVFFRQQAFRDGWLERVLQGSEDFAQKLTDKLEAEVYEALELIAQGFLEYRRNKLTATPQNLRLIYEQSLVLLYRLLFIFYAESRNILPVEQQQYGKHLSLTSIKTEAVNDKRLKNKDRGHFYMRLQDLFFAIDSGSDQYDVPPYNGRLFSDEEHPFLANNGVGDAYLVRALDKLARVDDNGKRVFVDYRDLEVRHLGSIYEKLLEYELDIATEPLTVKGADEQFVPAKGKAKVVKDKGQVYLRTGNNQRKVTGSYYTPDYIVRFIVEKTLEPLLLEITERHAERNEQDEWVVRDADRLVADILAVNVLDPATGSGHFIVDAISYMAEWLRDLNITNGDLERDEDELVYWKRQVAASCMYAVDLNPLAVELAKLSVWLVTLAKGKPLSFLDHHLRVGNSLVGVRLADVQDATVLLDDEKRARRAKAKHQQQQDEGQAALFEDDLYSEGVGFAVQQMVAIEGTVAESIADVKAQEKLYQDLLERLDIWKQAADVWAARYFGLALTANQWQAVRDWVSNGINTPEAQAIIQQAQVIAKDQRFFHWEMAFPEVFFNADGSRREQAGFDAVIGNPPYVRQERIMPIKPFLELNMTTYQGTADLFLYFYERGLQFLRPKQRLGYITSGTFMNSNSASNFRQYIHEQAGVEWVANFGENQPFKGAEMVYPTIMILRNGHKSDTFQNLFVEGNVAFDDLEEALWSGEWTQGLSDITGMSEWRFQAVELTELFKKISGQGTPLEQYIQGQIYRGVVTGFNEAFIIDKATRDRLVAEDASSAKIIKPMVRGADLRPWYQLHSNEYMIFAYQGIDIEQYPAVKKHLAQYRKDLEPKPLDWNTKKQGTWQGRASGSYQWYELQSTVAYWENFENPKIFVPDIGKLPRFSWDDSGTYCNDKGTIIRADYSVLAVLNSRVSWFALSQIATPLRLRGGLWQYQAKIQFVERLPIPTLTDAQEKELESIAAQLTAHARARYQVHEDFRQTLVNEFRGEAISTRVDLYRWWELADEKALNDEIKRRFDAEIPIKKRAEWRDHLAEQQAEHARITALMVELETRLNVIVYDAFGLTDDERALIEAHTKYPYGSV